MSWHEAFSERYDAWAAHMTADVPCYVDLAREADGPIVELAVGTGSVAIPVALATGRRVIGVDVSPGMLRQARAHAAADASRTRSSRGGAFLPGQARRGAAAPERAKSRPAAANATANPALSASTPHAPGGAENRWGPVASSTISGTSNCASAIANSGHAMCAGRNRAATAPTSPTASTPR
ncbi:MAG: class I SAM-dependent methyltransferase [Trueperaceae bacterium]|nr:class I SAM-dependent methyltransferase [Trueperaceae bacterium]